MKRPRRITTAVPPSGAPFLRRVVSLPEKFDPTRYPFDIQALSQGLYILDEPEAALSPQRKLSFLKIIHGLETPGHAQFLIATHSPILLGYPGAVLFSFDGNRIQEIAYRNSDHYRLTRDFLNAPERY